MNRRLMRILDVTGAITLVTLLLWSMGVSAGYLKAVIYYLPTGSQRLVYAVVGWAYVLWLPLLLLWTLAGIAFDSCRILRRLRRLMKAPFSSRSLKGMEGPEVSSPATDPPYELVSAREMDARAATND